MSFLDQAPPSASVESAEAAVACRQLCKMLMPGCVGPSTQDPTTGAARARRERRKRAGPEMEAEHMERRAALRAERVRHKVVSQLQQLTHEAEHKVPAKSMPLPPPWWRP